MLDRSRERPVAVGSAKGLVRSTKRSSNPGRSMPAAAAMSPARVSRAANAATVTMSQV
jgi:hypothetical protein